MTPHPCINIYTFLRFTLILLSLCLLATEEFAQTAAAASEPTGVLRLKIKPKVDGKDKELGRKRFFLLKGSLDGNKALVDKIGQQTFPTRECYYRNIKASDGFIAWLKSGDCESVYCRLIEDRFVNGPEAVPEFRAAYERSLKEYKTPELGRQWLTTNLTDEIRDGFYRLKRSALKGLLREAEVATGSAVLSVMTDRKGTAYFTDLSPGTYLVTNLIPTEVGANEVIWTCEVKIGTGEKRLQIPALRNSNVKCVVSEKPLPACDVSKQTASAK